MDPDENTYLSGYYNGGAMDMGLLVKVTYDGYVDWAI